MLRATRCRQLSSQWHRRFYTKQVKAHTPGFVITPAVARPDDPVAKLDALRGAKGFCSVCITDTGKLGGR